MSSLKQALRSIRNYQPINDVTVPAARAICNVLGVRPKELVRRLVRTGPVTQQLPNGRKLTLWSCGDDEVPTLLYWYGWSGYEPETSSLFYRLAGRAQVTLDIGAHAGYFTVLAAQANPSGQVFAFDPLPENQARLRKQLELNRLDNVTLVEAALGDFSGEADFFNAHGIGHGLPSGGSLSRDHFAGVEQTFAIRVPVMTVDQVMADRRIGTVDLVKMDTEATEPSVLRGMAATIDAHRPLIICEVLCQDHIYQELEDVLAPHGYHYYHLTPDGPAPKDRIKGDPQFRNYLFTHLDHTSVAQL